MTRNLVLGCWVHLNIQVIHLSHSSVGHNYYMLQIVFLFALIFLVCAVNTERQHSFQKVLSSSRVHSWPDASQFQEKFASLALCISFLLTDICRLTDIWVFVHYCFVLFHFIWDQCRLVSKSWSSCLLSILSLLAMFIVNQLNFLCCLPCWDCSVTITYHWFHFLIFSSQRNSKRRNT